MILKRTWTKFHSNHGGLKNLYKFALRTPAKIFFWKRNFVSKQNFGQLRFKNMSNSRSCESYFQQGVSKLYYLKQKFCFKRKFVSKQNFVQLRFKKKADSSISENYLQTKFCFTVKQNFVQFCFKIMAHLRISTSLLEENFTFSNEISFLKTKFCLAKQNFVQLRFKSTVYSSISESYLQLRCIEDIFFQTKFLFWNEILFSKRLYPPKCWIWKSLFYLLLIQKF